MRGISSLLILKAEPDDEDSHLSILFSIGSFSNNVCHNSIKRIVHFVWVSCLRISFVSQLFSFAFLSSAKQTTFPPELILRSSNSVANRIAVEGFLLPFLKDSVN